MAAVPMNQSMDPALTELLNNLEPNILPAQPSVWPLAIGYWLILFATLVVIGASIYWWRRTRLTRQVNRELKRLSRLNDVNEQQQQSHRLIRWLCIHAAGQSAAMTDIELTNFVASLTGRVPDWLNSHYQKSNTTPVDSSELSALTKQLLRKGAA